MSGGPLTHLRIVEFAGIGPAPFAGMLLSDLGAEVIRIDRHDAPPPDPGYRVLARGRQSIALNLKNPQALPVIERLVARSDALIEGFRPGVMERLGLGPQALFARHPKLVFGRVTGWGQHGPLSQAAGHDLNYIALTGLLNAMGPRNGPPIAPLNLLGDFAGGGMLLAFGVLAAICEAQRSGRGQIVDAAMVDGASLLGSLIWGMRSGGWWRNPRGENLLDGGAHFYGVFECSDGKWISLAAIEPQFYAQLLQELDLDPAGHGAQMDARTWPAMRETIAARVRHRTRDEWSARFEGKDICFAPVLNFDEALSHPHNRERGSFQQESGVAYPAPAPRFSRTPATAGSLSGKPGGDTRAVLERLGFAAREIDTLLASGAATATAGGNSGEK